MGSPLILMQVVHRDRNSPLENDALLPICQGLKDGHLEERAISLLFFGKTWTASCSGVTFRSKGWEWARRKLRESRQGRVLRPSLSSVLRKRGEVFLDILLE